MIKLNKIKPLFFVLMLVFFTACSQGGQAERASQADKQLTIHFIDVGQADCTLIMLPTGENVLVDAGNRDDKAYIINYLNNLGISHIDAAVATHPHEDHIGAMQYILADYDVDMLLLPDFDIDTNVYTNMLYAMEENNVEEVQVTEPFAMEIGNTVFDILAPTTVYSDANNNSIVFKMTYGEKTFLFTGDIEKEAERDILNSGRDIKANVIKVAHHGSNTSSTMDFLSEVNPDLAIIHVGIDNPYGCPDSRVLERLGKTEILRTDLLGDIVLSCDGKNITTSYSGVEGRRFENEKSQAIENSTVGRNKNDQETDLSGAAECYTYIGNKNSKVFHLPNCRSLPAEKNRVYFEDMESAMDAGYHACSICQK